MERYGFELKDKVVVLNGSLFDDYAGNWVNEMEEYVGLEFYISKFITDGCDDAVNTYGVRLMDDDGLDLGWIFDMRCLVLASEDDLYSEDFSDGLAAFYQ